MKNVALVCLSVLAFPFLVDRVVPISQRIRGLLSADELRTILMLVATGWLAMLLVLFSMSNELPGELFIYGRF